MKKKMDFVAAGMSGKNPKSATSASEIKFLLWALLIIGGLVWFATTQHDAPKPSVEQPRTDIRVPDRVRLTTAAMSCKKLADMQRVQKLVNDDDQKAAMNYAATHDCQSIHPPLTGRAEDFTLMYNNMICVRPDGQPDCLWTDRRRFQKVGD